METPRPPSPKSVGRAPKPPGLTPMAVTVIVLLNLSKCDLWGSINDISELLPQGTCVLFGIRKTSRIASQEPMT